MTRTVTRMWKVLDRFPQHFDRALHVRLDDDRQLADLAFLDLLVEGFEVAAWCGVRLPPRGAWSGGRARSGARPLLIGEDLERVAGLRTSSSPSRPPVSTVRPRVTRFSCSSTRRATRPTSEPTNEHVADAQVPFWTSTVSIGPRALFHLASEYGAARRDSGLRRAPACRSRQDHLEQVVDAGQALPKVDRDDVASSLDEHAAVGQSA